MLCGECSREPYPCIDPVPRLQVARTPMSPYRRNVMVGATILVALIALGWMLVQFGARVISPFTPPRMALTVTSERADGLSDGSPVLYRGVIVGQVTGVTRDPDQKHVYIKIMVDAAPPL